MKRLHWLPLLAAGVYACAQDVAQKIDFSHSAAPTRVVLEALSKQTGVPLFVTGAAAQEIVIIKVKDAVLDDVLKRIADVSSCEWKVEGDGFRLIPSVATRNREAKTERDARVAALRKLIAERDKALNAHLKPGENWMNEAMLGMYWSPDLGSNAITRLLSQLDLGLLADLQHGQRIVFSTNPTRMQRALGRSATTVIAEFVKEHNDDVKMQEEMGNTAMSDEDGQREMITGTPAKALLIGHRTTDYVGLEVQLVLYDAQGKVLLTANDDRALGLRRFEEIARMASREEPKAAEQKPDPDPTPIEFSAITKELSQYLIGMGIPVGKPMSRELHQALLRPDRHDPLAFAPSEILVAIATAKKAQLVANLPDSLAGTASLMGNAKPTVGQATEQYFDGKELTAETKDGWLTVRPAKPDANRKMRVDRLALTLIVAAGEEKGVPSLDDFANYALACPPPDETPAAYLYIQLFAPNVAGSQDWDMLKFYATLSQGQRHLLVNGGRITIPSLTLPQRDIVEAMAFGAPPRLRVGPKKQTDGFDSLEWLSPFLPSTNDYREEPTELMPTGLPADAALVLQSRAAPIAIVAGDPEGGQGGGMEDASARRGALGVDDLARDEYIRQDPNYAEVAAMMPQLGKVRLGNRAMYEFTFNLGPNVFMDRSLNDDGYDASSEPVSMDNLPQGFKDQIAKRVEALKKSPSPFLGMGQRSVPPPQ